MLSTGSASEEKIYPGVIILTPFHLTYKKYHSVRVSYGMTNKMYGCFCLIFNV
ncbi:hypothetical protein EMIT036CA2_10498 [Chryseobacterium sp. IT-36CA2]